MSNPSGESGPHLRRLWIVLIIVVFASFAALLYFGRVIYQVAPPIPDRVVTTDGQELLTRKDIQSGQDVWRSIGGHELGSIWGHGSYVAPDWTADWLHREALWILNYWAKQEGADKFEDLDPEQQAALQVRLQKELRTNTYDPNTGTLTISKVRFQAIKEIQAYYMGIFRMDPKFDELRDNYAMPPGTVSTDERAQELTAFIFWASWSCITERPGYGITYTHNWPPDKLIGNEPTGAIIVVSVASFVLLIAGIGGLIWLFAATRDFWKNAEAAPPTDPIFDLEPTPAMRSTLKFFWLVGLLLVVQMAAGIVTAHYGVEGNSLYGIPLAKWIPYSLSRTWHVQLGIFWIATSWLATGLCLAPTILGHDPKWQRLGTNVLFIALIIVVAGSMTGEALGIQQKLNNMVNFWFGHQGYEYIDLGRFWQILLLVGLFLWVFLMSRALWPAFRTSQGVNKQLLGIFGLAVVAIALFYGAGLFWGQYTNLAIAEYWRWWVVHLWVEGFFEVFAVSVIAFVFVKLGLVRIRSATMAILFTTILYLCGGVLGLFHHLYFTGTPPVIMALGGIFSALELMPLVLIGFEGMENWRVAKRTTWAQHYKWPIFWFVAVAFWNLVGAGIFGFLINPPIALYFMQGLNTTPLHGHAALFGVYGMLGIGLTLLSLRLLTIKKEWKTGPLKFGFWAMNIGLGLMILLSLLPVGLAQTWASVEHGMWYARSAEFLQNPTLQTLRWLRMIGDIIFGLGILAIGWFVIGISTGWSIRGIRKDAQVTTAS